MTERENQRALLRWRLLLGRYAQAQLGACGEGTDAERMDAALDFLYGREYEGRSVRETEVDRSGGSGGSRLTVPEWLREVRDLFPVETVEVLQHDALERYEMTELVTDAEVLASLEPDYDLLKSVLSFRGLMKGAVVDVARQVVARVVDELTRRLRKHVRHALWGALHRRSSPTHRGPMDFVRTIRRNLEHYDPERRRIVLAQPYFYARRRPHLPWHIIMAVDSSGSMIDSVIHSAVMAGIFHGLPAVEVSLVIFDTAVVDLTQHAADPVEVLMSVQLGGGTDIGKALAYCETLVHTPSRTVVVFVTDFFEGGGPTRMLASIKRLRGAGVRVLGLAALDERAQPSYDHALAARCVAAGADVAAMTPNALVDWLAAVLR